MLKFLDTITLKWITLFSSSLVLSRKRPEPFWNFGHMWHVQVELLGCMYLCNSKSFIFKVQNMIVGEASTIATIKVGDAVAHPPSYILKKTHEALDKVLGWAWLGFTYLQVGVKEYSIHTHLLLWPKSGTCFEVMTILKTQIISSTFGLLVVTTRHHGEVPSIGSQIDSLHIIRGYRNAVESKRLSPCTKI